jgi:hypothetical protein
LSAPDTIINGHGMMRSSTVGLRRSPCPCTLRCMPSLISPVAWLPLPSGMFYREQRLAPSFNQGRNSAYNEKNYDYVPTKKVKRRRGDPSRGSSCPRQPDKHDHNATARYGRSALFVLAETRSTAEIGGRIEVETQGWKPKNEVKRSPVPRVLKGADLYVVRRTKTGLGCAQPCWRW